MTPHPAGGRKGAFALIEFHQGSEARSTYGSPAKRDFGYLQSLSLKDENHLWATTCKLKQEKTECFAANVGRIFPMTCGSASRADALLLRLLFRPALQMQLQRWHQHCHLLQNQEREFPVLLTGGLC